MLTSITISADVASNARAAAINQARAQGWARVTAFSVTQVGPRLYHVVLDVTR